MVLFILVLFMIWRILVTWWFVSLYLLFKDDFSCKEEYEGQKESGPKTLILSDDALILFENHEGNIGKIEFWSTLYALSDVQINKIKKFASMTFYSDDTDTEKKIKIKTENILFFREALVKRMNSLKVKVDSIKILKDQEIEKRLTDKEINSMEIDNIIKTIDDLVVKIKNNEVNFYIVNTFMRLIGRVRRPFYY